MPWRGGKTSQDDSWRGVERRCLPLNRPRAPDPRATRRQRSRRLQTTNRCQVKRKRPRGFPAGAIPTVDFLLHDFGRFVKKTCVKTLVEAAELSVSKTHRRKRTR